MFKRIHSDEGGFTLVELLVTISILAILFGIVALSLSGVGTNAETTVMAAELGVVQSAVDIYMAVENQATITARDAAACGTITSAVGEFSVYLRHMPTQYCYWWTAPGDVTQCACP